MFKNLTETEQNILYKVFLFDLAKENFERECREKGIDPFTLYIKFKKGLEEED